MQKQDFPQPLPGFSGINRYWDFKHQTIAAKILPGEYYVSTQQELIATVLGSCVSACVWDGQRGIGDPSSSGAQRTRLDIAPMDLKEFIIADIRHPGSDPLQAGIGSCCIERKQETPVT